jgi:predicted Ser/Thr protein kinase
MRINGSRKKKLIVAFHFQFANRAGWNCDECRKNGLEVRRRCGFLPAEARGAPRLVWARKRAQSEECPKSFVTGESLSLVEEFFVRRRLGVEAGMETPARKLDAFLILREELDREEKDGTSPQH